MAELGLLQAKFKSIRITLGLGEVWKHMDYFNAFNAYFRQVQAYMGEVQTHFGDFRRGLGPYDRDF